MIQLNQLFKLLTGGKRKVQLRGEQAKQAADCHRLSHVAPALQSLFLMALKLLERLLRDEEAAMKDIW